MTLQQSPAILIPAAAVVIIAVRWRWRLRRERAWAAGVAEYVREVEYLAHAEKELAGTAAAELAWMIADSADDLDIDTTGESA